MAKDKPADFNVSNPNPMPAVGTATIDAPELTQDGKQLQLNARSVKTTQHAWEICTATETANKHRSLRTADIQAVYDGAPPRNFADKLQKAQNYQSNFSTRWLAGIVDVAVLRMVKAITSQVYLTKSQLPSTFQNFKEKSGIFQAKATKLFRAWPGFSDITNRLTKEDALHGYCYAVWMDTFTWKPTFFSQENAYVPEQSGMDLDQLQFFVAKQDFLLHEFIDLFQDEQAASDAGYDIENCVLAANAATIRNPRDDIMTTQYRKFADMIADGTLGLTYTAVGPRIVKVYMLWNREYDGKVSFWIIERDTGRLLRFSEKIYDKMSQVVTAFSLEPGNGHIHSSKGLGRKLISMALAIEEGRNNAADASRLGAMLALKVPTKDRAKLQPVIHSPFIVLPSEIDVVQQRFGINADEFLKLDTTMAAWVQQSSGAYISSNLDPAGTSKKTATESSIDAAREQESTDQVRARFIDQFAAMITQMQERAFSDDNIAKAKRIFERIAAGEEETESVYEGTDDADTIRTIVEMLKFELTADEIKILRKSSATGIAHADDIATNSGITQLAALYTGNPNIDQIELLKRNVEAIAGPEAAKQLVIGNLDQTIASEAARQQLLEATSMIQLGLPVPVSPRDNHTVHAITLKTLLESTIPTLSQNPTPDQKLMKGISLGINHMAEHLEAASTSGNNSKDVAELGKWLTQFTSDFKQAVQIQEQAKAGAEVGLVAGKMAAMGAPMAAPAANQPASQASELDIGAKIGMEHTNDPAEAQKIAQDHINENPQYYSKMIEAGLAEQPTQ